MPKVLFQSSMERDSLQRWRACLAAHHENPTRPRAIKREADVVARVAARVPLLPQTLKSVLECEINDSAYFRRQLPLSSEIGATLLCDPQSPRHLLDHQIDFRSDVRRHGPSTREHPRVSLLTKVSTQRIEFIRRAPNAGTKQRC